MTTDVSTVAPMDNATLAALVAAAREATPGPWGGPYLSGPDDVSVWPVPLGEMICGTGNVSGRPRGDPMADRIMANAAYIAAANPSAILALAARCEAAEARGERLAAALAKDGGPVLVRDVGDPVALADSLDWSVADAAEDGWLAENTAANNRATLNALCSLGVAASDDATYRRAAAAGLSAWMFGRDGTIAIRAALAAEPDADGGREDGG